MPVSDVTLIFNGSCSACTKLARQANEYSNNKISIVPLSSVDSREKLQKFYPDGIPFDFFLIETNDRGSSCHRGNLAALKLPKYLGSRGSFKLLRTYLQFRAHSTRISGKIISQANTEVRSNSQATSRRMFVNVILAAGIAILLSKANIGNIFASGRVSSPNGSLSSGNGGNYVIRADRMIKQPIPEKIKHQLEDAITKNRSAGRPSDPLPIITDPDCIYGGCYCGSGYYCVDCVNFACVCYCWNGCSLVPTSCCIPACHV